MTTLESEAALRTMYRQPGERAINKVVHQLDEHCYGFINQSPFCVLGTATPDGNPDLSPRGGDPGFVHIHDSSTLLLADRPGNNRLDSLGKIASNPSVTLLFFVPGIDDTLRVYGSASIEPTGQYADIFQVEDKKSITVLRIAVERAMFHCPKALMRSRLWDPATQDEGNPKTSIVDIVSDQMGEARTTETQAEVIQRLASEL